MKKLAFVAVLSLISTLAFSASSMSQFKNLEGKAGIGKNAYEGDKNFDCYVEIDENSNTLTIIHQGAYESTVFFGDDVVKSTKTSSGLTLSTAETNPSKSGLCGDFSKARNLKDTLEVNKNSIKMTRSYKCGLIGKTNEDVFTCNLK